MFQREPGDDLVVAWDGGGAVMGFSLSVRLFDRRSAALAIF